MRTQRDVVSLLGIDHPIIQGPFGGGLSTPELVAAVSNVGGLGSYGAHYLPPEGIAAIVEEIRTLTAKPFAINLWVSDWDEAMSQLDRQTFEKRRSDYDDLYRKMKVPPPEWPGLENSKFERQVEEVLRLKPNVFSFVFGIPSQEILRECRKQGIVTIGAATSIEESMVVEAAGVDMLVVSGFEAGGHRPSFLRPAEESLNGIMALLPSVRERVEIPVIAAGGIADRRGVRAAMALGADAVQVGTAFLACEESGAHPLHRRAIRENGSGATTLTRAYTGRLARFIPNGFIRRFENHRLSPLPFPAQSWLTQPIKEAAAKRHELDCMALYSSQSSPLVHLRNVNELMRELTADTI